MKITEKELRKLIREAVSRKLQEAVTDKDKVPSEDWVKYISDVDKFVNETIEKAKELAEAGEDLKAKELKKDGNKSFVNDRRSKEYQVVDHRMNFVKNLVTKLSSVDFDASEWYYKGKV